MRKSLALVVLLAMASTFSFAAAKDEKEEDRVKEAGQTLKEIINIPDNIPKDLFDKAECVIVLPSVKKGAIGIGGSYGRGVMSCRSGEHYTGSWSAPAMYALEGFNIGFQLGGQATDFVILVMNPRGAESLMGSKVKLGADASAAAGPKGRSAQGATDVVMRAEMLSYSRSRGLFAGVSLEGSTLRPDRDGNALVYGGEIAPRELVKGGVAVPSAAKGIVEVLNQHSPKNLSEGK